jgi:hypothetical protein
MNTENTESLTNLPEAKPAPVHRERKPAIERLERRLREMNIFQLAKAARRMPKHYRRFRNAAVKAKTEVIRQSLVARCELLVAAYRLLLRECVIRKIPCGQGS